MRKDASLKSFRSKKQNKILNQESSTQNTDFSDFLNCPSVFETPKISKTNNCSRPEIEKLISRTGSVSLLKQSPMWIEFDFFGFMLRLDISKKEETS
jgi:hypothetical protein